MHEGNGMPMKHKRAHATYTEADRGDTMLLFFDIDGTIFDDKRHLPATVKPAMEAAHRNGHQLIINTGRTLCNMDRRLDDFPLDGWIMGCGTRVIWHGNTIQSMEYGPEESQRLRKLFQDRFFILSGTKDQTVIEFFDIQFHSILIIVEFLSKFVPLKKDPGGSLWLNLFPDVFVVIVFVVGRCSIE